MQIYAFVLSLSLTVDFYVVAGWMVHRAIWPVLCGIFFFPIFDFQSFWVDWRASLNMVVNCQSNYLMYYFMGFRFHGFFVPVSRSGLDGGGGGGGDVEAFWM